LSERDWWAQLPDGVDAVDLARRAIGEGIVLALGPVFSTSGGWRNHVGFDVAMSDDDRLSAFLQRART
jgi:DNA-binding transcriptional MocR family regulator